MSRQQHPIPEGRPCSHKRYRLTCDEYDEMFAISDHRCWICGGRPVGDPPFALCVDHDGAVGDWAARGLLCSGCNPTLEIPNHARTAEESTYLDNPWYLTLLARAGVSPDPMPEPPYGTTVRIGSIDYKRGGGSLRWWYRVQRPEAFRLAITWEDAWYRYGPRGITILSTSPKLLTYPQHTTTVDGVYLPVYGGPLMTDMTRPTTLVELRAALKRFERLSWDERFRLAPELADASKAILSAERRAAAVEGSEVEGTQYKAAQKLGVTRQRLNNVIKG